MKPWKNRDELTSCRLNSCPRLAHFRSSSVKMGRSPRGMDLSRSVLGPRRSIATVTKVAMLVAVGVLFLWNLSMLSQLSERVRPDQRLRAETPSIAMLGQATDSADDAPKEKPWFLQPETYEKSVRRLSILFLLGWIPTGRTEIVRSLAGRLRLLHCRDALQARRARDQLRQHRRVAVGREHRVWVLARGVQSQLERCVHRHCQPLHG